MKSVRGWQGLGATLAALSVAGLGWAQQAVYAEYQGKAFLVRKVRDGFPYVADGERLVRAGGDRIGLVGAKEFLPYFVSVEKMRAVSSHVDVTFSGGATTEVNHTLEFHADFESPFWLENVFLVLELEVATGPRLFLHEVGELAPHVPRHVSVFVPVAERLDETAFKLHLFADGGELLHSGQPAGLREEALNRMTARRIAGDTDAPIRPFVGPAPEYPEAMRKRNVPGQAVVKFRVGRTGAVVEPEVKSATSPEFGEAALAAARLWRFLPKVQEGQPVESSAEMPFKFNAPEPPAK